MEAWVCGVGAGRGRGWGWGVVRAAKNALRVQLSVLNFSGALLMWWAWLIWAWESGPRADPVLRWAERDVSVALPGISSLQTALKASFHSSSKSQLNGWAPKKERVWGKGCVCDSPEIKIGCVEESGEWGAGGKKGG